MLVIKILSQHLLPGLTWNPILHFIGWVQGCEKARVLGVQKGFWGGVHWVLVTVS